MGIFMIKFFMGCLMMIFWLLELLSVILVELCFEKKCKNYILRKIKLIYVKLNNLVNFFIKIIYILMNLYKKKKILKFNI